MVEFGEHRNHPCVWVSEKDTATDANEDPTEAFENSLSLKVTLKLLRSVPLLAITLDGKPPGLSFNDKINAIRTHRPLGLHTITSGKQTLEHQHLEGGLGALALFFHHAQQCLWVTCVLDEPASEVSGFEMRVGI